MVAIPACCFLVLVNKGFDKFVEGLALGFVVDCAPLSVLVLL